MLKLGIVGDGNDGIAPLTGCPVPVPTSKPDQYTPVTLLLLQHRPLGHPPSSLHLQPDRAYLESRPLSLSLYLATLLSTDLRRYIHARVCRVIGRRPRGLFEDSRGFLLDVDVRGD